VKREKKEGKERKDGRMEEQGNVPLFPPSILPIFPSTASMTFHVGFDKLRRIEFIEINPSHVSRRVPFRLISNPKWYY
jgi:hypothetical protein